MIYGHSADIAIDPEASSAADQGMMMNLCRMVGEGGVQDTLLSKIGVVGLALCGKQRDAMAAGEEIDFHCEPYWVWLRWHRKDCGEVVGMRSHLDTVAYIKTREVTRLWCRRILHVKQGLKS